MPALGSRSEVAAAGSSLGLLEDMLHQELLNTTPVTTQPILFRSSASGTYNAASSAVSLPAGIQAGDHLVLWSIRSANDATATTPSGWSQQGSIVTASSLAVAVYTRTATSSETAPTLQWASSGRVTWLLEANTGVDPTSPVDAISIVPYLTAAASNSHTVPSVSATTDNTIALEAVINKAATVETDIAAPAGVTRDAFFYNPSTSSPNIAVGRSNTDTDTGQTGGGHTWTSVQSSQRILVTMLLRPAVGTAPGGTPGTVTHLWPGAPNATGFKLLAKTSGATSLRLAVSTSADMSSPVYVSAQTPDGSSRTTHTVTGLSPNTRYYYRLADTPSGGSETLIGTVGTIRTLQTQGVGGTTRKISFGGCVRTNSSTVGALNDVVAWAPDYGIFNGDFSYGGTGSTVQSVHEAVYENQLQGVPALRSLVQAGGAAFIMASDHDTSNIDNANSNDATGTASLAARKVVWPLANIYATTTESQWDDGRVSYYAIDVRTTDRSTGSNTDDASKTMLGSAQKARLLNWLSTNPAPFKVIVGDTAWMGTADLVNKTDWWPAYTTERTEISNAINAAQANGTHVEYWHGDSHLIGYATAAKNTWGNFPVLCAAGFDQDGGGRNTSTFSAFWNNSSGAVQQYGRITLVDNGTTITRTFSGWDAAGSTERVSNSVTITPSSSPVVQTGAGNVETAIVHTPATDRITVNKPANTAVGDYLLAWIASQNNSNVAPPTSAGWTPVGPIYSVTGDAGRRPSGLFAMEITDATMLANLPANWTWTGPTGTGRWGGGIVRVTGVPAGSNPATWDYGSYSTSSTAGTTTRDLPSFTSSANSQTLIAVIASQMSAVTTPTGSTFPAGMTEAFDISSLSSGAATAHQTMSLAFQNQNIGSTGTRTVTMDAVPASSSGFMVAIPGIAVSNTRTPTTTRVIAHRGTLDSAADTTENQISGLNILSALRRPINGVEIDARLPSDWATTGAVFLCHDETVDRTSPTGATGTVATMTTAQLDAAGIARLDTYLAACVGRGFDTVMVQHYTPANTAQCAIIVDMIKASPFPSSRVMIMTSISGPYAPANIRAAGWTGRLGTYGSTASNYAGSGDGKASDFSTYGITAAFLPPGAYNTNRSHATTLTGAGIQLGASTENTLPVWQNVIADNGSYILTDNSDTFLANYEPPAPMWDVSGSGSLTGTSSQNLVQTANLSGSGSLTALSVPAFAHAASFTGSGSLVGLSSQNAMVSASFNGTGLLTSITAPYFTTSRFLTGTGTLRTARRVTGLMGRSLQVAQGNQRTLIDGFVYDPDWSSLQTTAGVLDATAVTNMRAALDWAQANTGTSGLPLGVRLRVRGGFAAPQFVKDAVGTVVHYTDNGTDAAGQPQAPSNPNYRMLPGGIPKTWTPAYAGYVDELWRLLAAEFGDHPAWRDAVMFLPSTQFPEVMNRQFGLQENVDAHVAAGWTEALDDESYKVGARQIRDRLSYPFGIGCYVAHNPPGKVTGTTFTNGYPERTNSLMQWLYDNLGQYAVVGNNSLVSPFSGQTESYQSVYVKIRELAMAGAATSGQTETLGKIVSGYPAENLRDTITMARNEYGMHSVEIPIGAQNQATGQPSGAPANYQGNYIDVAYATTENNLLRNRLARPFTPTFASDLAWPQALGSLTTRPSWVANLQSYWGVSFDPTVTDGDQSVFTPTRTVVFNDLPVYSGTGSAGTDFNKRWMSYFGNQVGYAGTWQAGDRLVLTSLQYIAAENLDIPPSVNNVEIVFGGTSSASRVQHTYTDPGTGLMTRHAIRVLGAANIRMRAASKTYPAVLETVGAVGRTGLNQQGGCMIDLDPNTTRFQGQDLILRGSRGAGFFAYRADNYWLNRVTVEESQADGFHQANGSSYGLFTNCISRRTGDDGWAVVRYNGEAAIASSHHMAVFRQRVEGTGHGRGFAVICNSDIWADQMYITGTAAAGVLVDREASGATPYVGITNVLIQRVSFAGCNWSEQDHGTTFVRNGTTTATVTGIQFESFYIKDTRLNQTANRAVGSGQINAVYKDFAYSGGLPDPANSNRTKIGGDWASNGSSTATITNWTIDTNGPSDSTSPTIAFLAPGPGAAVAGTTVAGPATGLDKTDLYRNTMLAFYTGDVGGSLSSVVVKVGATTIYTGSEANLDIAGRIAISGINWSAFPNGLNTLSVTSTDPSGNTTTQSRDIMVSNPTSFVVDANFSGSGSLSGTQTASVAVPASLSGSGTLTATQTSSVSQSMSLSGSGTLSAAVSAGYRSTATLSGSGTATATSSVTTTQAASLSGSGSLSASQTATSTQSAALTGSGSLSGTSSQGYTVQAGLSGLGTSSSTQTPSVTIPASVSGSGTLSGTATSSFTQAASFAGSGLLLAGSGQSFAVAGNTTGTGTLSNTVSVAASTTAGFAGSGSLTATSSVSVTQSASLSGSGTTSATQTASFIRSGSLTGTGTATATQTLSVSRTSGLSGSGTVSAVQVANFSRVVSTSGSGTLTASSTPSFSRAGSATGSGTLTAVLARAASGSGQTLTGTAVLLTGQATPNRTGSGTNLVTTSLLTSSGSSNRSGQNTLPATALLTSAGRSARAGGGISVATASLGIGGAEPSASGYGYTLTGTALLTSAGRANKSGSGQAVAASISLTSTGRKAGSQPGTPITANAALIAAGTRSSSGGGTIVGTADDVTDGRKSTSGGATVVATALLLPGQTEGTRSGAGLALVGTGQLLFSGGKKDSVTDGDSYDADALALTGSGTKSVSRAGANLIALALLTSGGLTDESGPGLVLSGTALLVIGQGSSSEAGPIVPSRFEVISLRVRELMATPGDRLEVTRITGTS